MDIYEYMRLQDDGCPNTLEHVRDLSVSYFWFRFDEAVINAARKVLSGYFSIKLIDVRI